MKLLTLLSGAVYHPAVIVGDDVLDLIACSDIIAQARALPSTMSAMLAGGAEALQAVHEVVSLAKNNPVTSNLRATGALMALRDARVGPVVPNGNLVLAGSMNSRGHVAEMGDEPPPYPCAFHKVRSALSASGADIVPPAGHADMIDWEGEFCVVIGKRCHRVSVDDALDYVVGYTLMNDVSAREFVLPFVTAVGASPTAQAWERNVLGKNFPTFAPIGPCLVTRDEFPEPFAYHLETLVNGEVMQSSTQDDLVFGPAEMVSYFSNFYVFEPGDIISMGSPPGVGMARKPQLFLKPGDVVEVREAHIGTLINRIATVVSKEA